MLGDALRLIRSRNGWSQAQLAKALGCSTITISRYELGRLSPSRSMLLLLLRFAETKQEQAPILELLGFDDPAELAGSVDSDVMKEAARKFEQYLAAGGKGTKQRSGDQLRRQFAEVAERILIGDLPVEPALVAILEKWVYHHSNPKAREFFRNLDVYLDVELSRERSRDHRGKEKGR